jgi:Spy/CpxP family protein refolding chaperone
MIRASFAALSLFGFAAAVNFAPAPARACGMIQPFNSKAELEAIRNALPVVKATAAQREKIEKLLAAATPGAHLNFADVTEVMSILGLKRIPAKSACITLRAYIS